MSLAAVGNHYAHWRAEAPAAPISPPSLKACLRDPTETSRDPTETSVAPGLHGSKDSEQEWSVKVMLPNGINYSYRVPIVITYIYIIDLDKDSEPEGSK